MIVKIIHLLSMQAVARARCHVLIECKGFTGIRDVFVVLVRAWGRYF